MAKRTIQKSPVSSRRPSTSSSDENLSSTKRRSNSASLSDEGEITDQVESIRKVSGQKSSASMGGKNMWKDLISNPAVRYVAGGIATAILTKVASNFSTKYPELSRFINENLDGVEGRLAEFKNGLNSNSEVSRH